MRPGVGPGSAPAGASWFKKTQCGGFEPEECEGGLGCPPPPRLLPPLLCGCPEEPLLGGREEPPLGGREEPPLEGREEPPLGGREEPLLGGR